MSVAIIHDYAKRSTAFDWTEGTVHFCYGSLYSLLFFLLRACRVWQIKLNVRQHTHHDFVAAKRDAGLLCLPYSPSFFIFFFVHFLCCFLWAVALAA